MHEGWWFDLWRASQSTIQALIVAALGYVLLLLRDASKAREQASSERAEAAVALEETRENVSRLTNGRGVQHDATREEDTRQQVLRMRRARLAFGGALVAVAGLVWVASCVQPERGA